MVVFDSQTENERNLEHLGAKIEGSKNDNAPGEKIKDAIA